jgi:hypothetical protein
MSRDEMLKTIQEGYALPFQMLSEQIARFEADNNKKLDEIIAHQKETNGRVTKLENETRIVRWAFNNPKSAMLLIVLIVAGCVFIGTVVGVDVLTSLF